MRYRAPPFVKSAAASNRNDARATAACESSQKASPVLGFVEPLVGRFGRADPALADLREGSSDRASSTAWK
jgi:hypothetical protein